MNRLAICTAVLASIGAAAPAGAQNGAMWVDQYGRMVSMQFAGGSDAPGPVDRSAAEMAALFKSLCLDGGGSENGLARAAKAADLFANPHVVPGSKKTGPITLEVWNGEGIAVSRTDGFFAARPAQCNATFYVSTLPDRTAVTSALSAAIGAEPSNLASAVDKKGKAKNDFTPEWTASGASGPTIVTAMVGKGSRYMPGNRVQISVRAAKKPAR
ncbi:MAG TPA: hypothetical protein VF650_08310 [Allosphingosinicella sp.]|jgi:hypothetical protein